MTEDTKNKNTGKPDIEAKVEESRLKKRFTRHNREAELEKETEQLKEAMEKQTTEYEELKQEAMRIKADFVNYRQRVERDRQKDRQLAAENAVESLLPVLDNLERTVAAGTDPDSPLMKGVAMVERQFMHTLETMGVCKISSDSKFDPSRHEAVGMSTADCHEADGDITQVIQCGYLLGTKVIRPARVIIAKHTPEGE